MNFQIIAALIREICIRSESEYHYEDEKCLQDVENIGLGLKALNPPKKCDLQYLVMMFLQHLENVGSSKVYFNLLKIVMEVGFEDFPTVVSLPVDISPTLFCQIRICQASMLDETDLSEFFSNFRNIEDLKVECQLIEKLLKTCNESMLVKSSDLMEALDNLLDCVVRSDDKSNLVVDITRVLLTLAEPPFFIDQATNYLNSLMENLTANDKAKALDVLIGSAEETKLFDGDNSLREWLKQTLVEKIVETDILTKEQQ
jgi:hypothetical protein